MKKTAVVIAAALMVGPLWAADQKPAAGQKQGKTQVQRKLAANKVRISLADARSRIDAAVKKPAVMRAIMSHLSAADQKSFVADFNKAISDMPASSEQKAAMFLNANMAAIDSAAKGNASTVIAEVFATVPTEMLTIVSQQLAEGPLNRSAVAGVTYTDAQFKKIATELMKKVNARCSEADNSAPREALAVAMMVSASQGSPADLADSLIETLPTAEARDLARNEWVPSALGKDGRQQSYEPILASADAGRRPDLDAVLVIAGPQFHDSVLNDLSFGLNVNYDIDARAPTVDAIENTFIRQTPIMGGDVGGDTKVGGADPEQNQGGDIPEGSDDRPYQWQRMH